MKAVVFDKELKLDTNYPKPIAGEGESLVRVHLAGICNTDLELIKGYMGYSGVLGHEFVGTAEDGPYKGKRVVGEINLPCLKCDTCLRGDVSHCPTRSVLGILNRDGAMAQYVTLPNENLHLVPDGVSDEEAVFVEPLAAAFEIMTQVQISPSDKVLVLGDGKLGILCALVLNQSKAQVTLAGRHDSKLKIADAQGVGTVLSSELKADRDYDLVVDATGSPEGFNMALGFVRPRGTIVLKTTSASGAQINLAPIVIDEITVIGSRCGPFSVAIEAIRSGVINVQPLISATYPLDDALSAFEAAVGSLKVLLRFGDSGLT
jgi:alcohol dehydrogenase